MSLSLKFISQYKEAIICTVIVFTLPFIFNFVKKKIYDIFPSLKDVGADLNRVAKQAGESVVSKMNEITPELKRLANERDDFLRRNGFAPCGDDALMIHDKIEDMPLSSSSANRFEITNAMRADINGRKVYMYDNRTYTHGDAHLPSTQLEIMTTFSRRTDNPAFLMLNSETAILGLLEKVAVKALPIALKSAHTDLVVLKLPPELERGKIAAVAGHKGSTVYNLLTPDELDIISRAADVGVMTVTLPNRDTAFFAFNSPPTDYSKLEEYLEELTKREETIFGPDGPDQK